METQRSDEDDVRAELASIASGDPIGPVDGHRLVQRARRQRRRRFQSAGSVAAAVIAVLAVSATLVIREGSAEPPAAGSSAVVTATTPRVAATSPPATPKPTGKVTPMPDPSTQADPTADDATVLRACSASLEIIKAGGRGWPMPLPHPPEYRPAATDLTGWRIAARSILPKVGTVFVAVSPDSKLTALCRVYTPGTRGEKGFRSEVLPFLQPPRTLTPYVIGGDGAYGPCDACRGWLIEAVGRIPPKVVRFRVEGKNQAIDVPVRNGWYALIWDGPKEFGLKATAYDAAGRVVRPSS